MTTGMLGHAVPIIHVSIADSVAKTKARAKCLHTTSYYHEYLAIC